MLKMPHGKYARLPSAPVIYNILLALWYLNHNYSNFDFLAGTTKPATKKPSPLVRQYIQTDLWYQEKSHVAPQRNTWTFFRLAHIAGANLWCLLMVPQLLDAPRKWSPKLHRVGGRVFFVLSCGIALSGFEGLLIRPRVFQRAIARFFGVEAGEVMDVNVLFGPVGSGVARTFVGEGSGGDVGLVGDSLEFWKVVTLLDYWLFFGINFMLLGSTAIALRHAVNRRIREHKVWALRHCMYGTWVIPRRMLMALFMMVLEGVAEEDRHGYAGLIRDYLLGVPFVIWYLITNFFSMVLHIILAEVFVRMSRETGAAAVKKAA